MRTVPFAVFTGVDRAAVGQARRAHRHQGRRHRRPACRWPSGSPSPRPTGVDTPYWRHRAWRCSSWAAASASSRRRPPRRSWARCRRPRPASARPSTTPPASSAARSAWPSSAACSRRSTPPGSATPSPARRCPPRRVRHRQGVGRRGRGGRRSRPARTAGPQAEAFVTHAVNAAFVDGWHAGSWVSLRRRPASARWSPGASCPSGADRLAASDRSHQIASRRALRPSAERSARPLSSLG